MFRKVLLCLPVLFASFSAYADCTGYETDCEDNYSIDQPNNPTQLICKTGNIVLYWLENNLCKTKCVEHASISGNQCVCDQNFYANSGSTACNNCPTNYTTAGTGSTQCSDCHKTCAAADFPTTSNGNFLTLSTPTGTLSASVVSNNCNAATDVKTCVFAYQCDAGYAGVADTATTNPNCVVCQNNSSYNGMYCPQGTAPNAVGCPNDADGSDGERKTQADCYKTYTFSIADGHITDICGTAVSGNHSSYPYNAHYNTGTYPQCQNITVQCDAGYTPTGNGTASPTCVACLAGNYIDNNSCVPCPDNHYCPGVANTTIANGCDLDTARGSGICKCKFGVPSKNDRKAATDCYIPQDTKICGTNGCITVPADIPYHS